MTWECRDAEELRQLKRTVEAILLAAGLPMDSLADFGFAAVKCEVHERSVRTSLRLPGFTDVAVLHCGCDHWLQPKAAPPSSLTEMAENLAGHIMWYWDRREDALAMLLSVRDAVDREMEEAHRRGDGWGFVDICMEDFETFRGQYQGFRVILELTGDSLLPQRWDRTFKDVRRVRQFFRNVRPYQDELHRCRAELANLGARGRIDRVAIAALEEVGVDPLAAIARCAGRSHLGPVERSPRKMALWWRFGTIETEVQIAPGALWRSGELHLQEVDLARSVRGLDRHVGDYLSSPLLDPHLRVRLAHISSDSVQLDVDWDARPFAIVNGQGAWV
jgi:hypothetical protein